MNCQIKSTKYIFLRYLQQIILQLINLIIFIKSLKSLVLIFFSKKQNLNKLALKKYFEI